MAFMQGGALGIYGDYLFSSSNRLGGGLMGPSWACPGSIAQGLRVVQGLRTSALRRRWEDPQPADVALLRRPEFHAPEHAVLESPPVASRAECCSDLVAAGAAESGYLQRSKRNLKKRNQGSGYLIDHQAVAW